nr:hypothetical protein [Burkholderia pseudomallei]
MLHVRVIHRCSSHVGIGDAPRDVRDAVRYAKTVPARRAAVHRGAGAGLGARSARRTAPLLNTRRAPVVQMRHSVASIPAILATVRFGMGIA